MKQVFLIDNLLYILSVFLLFNCVFDPAGLLFRVKDLLFVLIVLIYCVYVGKTSKCKKAFFNYLLVFAFILPFVSIVFYCLFHLPNGVNYDISSVKTYIFLSFSLVLYNLKRDVIVPFCKILTLLSIVIIVIYILADLIPGFIEVVNIFGKQYELGKIVIKQLGSYQNTRIYFWTSPLIVFACVHYFSKYFFLHKKIYLLLTCINVVGLFMSGSRMNMGISILVVPFLYWYYSSLRKRMLIYCALLLLFMIFFPLVYDFLVNNIITESDRSDQVRDVLLSDYMLFGQGVGSMFSQSRGLELSYSELTYIELYRRFGLILGSVYVFLLLYPLRNIFRYFRKYDSHIYIAFLIYLLMATFNPFLFSSSGMIILSIVLCNYFAKK